MTDEQFNSIYGLITTDIQDVFKRRFTIGISETQADILMSALGTVTGMFAAQDGKLLQVFDRVLQHSIEMVERSQRFQDGFAKLQSGELPEEDGLGLDVPNAAGMARSVRDGTHHGAHSCLYCALQATVVRFHGTKITDPVAAMEIFDAIAKLAAMLIVDIGSNGSMYFMGSLQASVDRENANRSVEGMTAQ